MQSTMCDERSQAAWAAVRNRGGICHTEDASIFAGACCVDCCCGCAASRPATQTNRQPTMRRSKRRGRCIFFPLPSEIYTLPIRYLLTGDDPMTRIVSPTRTPKNVLWRQHDDSSQDRPLPKLPTCAPDRVRSRVNFLYVQAFF